MYSRYIFSGLLGLTTSMFGYYFYKNNKIEKSPTLNKNDLTQNEKNENVDSTQNGK